MPYSARKQSGEETLFCTITVGNYIYVQGLLERVLDDGKAVVRVGDNRFTGRPVNKKTA
jgi:hypothetical protein